MTGWDVLDGILKNLPPIAAMVFLLAAGIIFAIGFSRYGINFIKYGFSQKEVGDLSKKIDDLRTEFKADKRFDDLGARIDGFNTEFKTELDTIKVNHFGHLKNFLAELTSILLDKDIINNQDKARLDNQLRGM